ncbi:MAG: YIP1 family protein [Kangiellaceae bacterium]|nr:YIP1 family protein [Kangiellaceae bacterium]
MSDNNLASPPIDNQPVTGNLAILTNIFTSPSTAMGQIQTNYSVAFPMLLVILLSAVVWFSYYSMVDYEWFVDYIVETTAGDLSKSEQDQTRAGMSMMPQSVMGSITAVTAAIAVALIYVVQAVYFLIVSNVNNDGYEFKQWLSFVTWTSLPVLLTILAMFAMLFSSSTGQIAPDALNPLSLNELIFGLDPSKGIGKLLSTIHLPQLWSLAIMVIGYSVWTKKSTSASSMIVLTPFVLFYVGWYLFL